MPKQEYECSRHGRFTKQQSFRAVVEPELACPKTGCGRTAKWVPQAPPFMMLTREQMNKHLNVQETEQEEALQRKRTSVLRRGKKITAEDMREYRGRQLP